VTGVHVAVGVAALALNVVAALFGGWCWWRAQSAPWFWRVLRGGQASIVLEAVRQNELGHLWSIDLPFPFDHRLREETGIVVTGACRPRWSYLEGSSKQRLPPLIAKIGHVGMFIHDSLHTAENTVFEMEQAASAMSAGGVMLVDDIGSHMGFATFTSRHPAYQTMICPSANRDGIFGIAVNAANT